MKFEVYIEEARRTVEIEPLAGGEFRARLDGHAVLANAVEIGSEGYSILLAGHSFEARVSPLGDDFLVCCAGREFRVQICDPRSWRADRRGALEATGRQQVVAPMPGKVVRVLVAAGEMVEAGRGLLVIEAMKMQNEIRAPKSGRIERVLVVEDQVVRAQEALVVIA
jgi:acetyl/propionyl-CoA carboxylase alpha subunit